MIRAVSYIVVGRVALSRTELNVLVCLGRRIFRCSVNEVLSSRSPIGELVSIRKFSGFRILDEFRVKPAGLPEIAVGDFLIELSVRTDL